MESAVAALRPYHIPDNWICCCFKRKYHLSKCFFNLIQTNWIESNSILMSNFIWGKSNPPISGSLCGKLQYNLFGKLRIWFHLIPTTRCSVSCSTADLNHQIFFWSSWRHELLVHSDSCFLESVVNLILRKWDYSNLWARDRFSFRHSEFVWRVI